MPSVTRVSPLVRSLIDDTLGAQSAQRMLDAADSGDFDESRRAIVLYEARADVHGLPPPVSVLEDAVDAAIQVGDVGKALAYWRVLHDQVGTLMDVRYVLHQSAVQLRRREHGAQVFTAKDIDAFARTGLRPDEVLRELDDAAGLPVDLTRLENLRALADIARAYPAYATAGRWTGVALTQAVNSAVGSDDRRLASGALDILVDLERVTKAAVADVKRKLTAKEPLALPLPFALGLVTAEQTHAAVAAALGAPGDTEAQRRANVVQLLAERTRIDDVAGAISVSREDLGAFLACGAGLGGWTLPGVNHRGVVFPGETLLAGSAFQDGELRSFAHYHPAGDGAKAKIDKLILEEKLIPATKVSFRDDTVPPQAQQHLVGRQKILSGEDVLRLYAAATAQPKSLAHHELVHHRPREAVLAAIGKFVGLEPDEVKKYFDGGGWGRLFNGMGGEPLVFVDTPVHPGQLVNEYLEVAGTAAPNALKDFLRAQTEPPQKDRAGNDVPFPVSDTALDLTFQRLVTTLKLDFKDPAAPQDKAREKLNEAKAKDSLKQWFENRFFFSGTRDALKEALPEPHCIRSGPTRPIAQSSFALSDAKLADLIRNDGVDAAVRRDALSRAMVEHVPGPDDEIALRDGSLKLAGFLRLVSEECADKPQLERNVLVVSPELVAAMELFDKNTEPLAARSDEAAARGPKPKTALELLEELDAPPDARTVMEQIFVKARAEQERIEAGMAPLGFSANTRLEGNPGTGKTTTARIIVQGVRESGLLPEPKNASLVGDILETTGRALMKMAKEGKLEDFFLEQAHGRGVLLDEIYQIDLTTPEGREVADFLLMFLEDHRTDTIVFTAGYADKLEKFFSSNPGFRSRFKHTAKFPDFTDKKLANAMKKMAADKGFTVADDVVDRAIGRLTKFRGSEGFGNARAVRNMIEGAIERLLLEGGAATGGALTWSHFFGDDAEALKQPTQAQRDLAKREGLHAVKAKIDAIDATLAENLEREELGMPPLPLSLHAAFVGNPGTGKTTVANDYGQFLKERRLLSKGEVIRVTREDLVGDHEGDTERKVREVLERAAGCVLLIDEAYTLDNDLYGMKALDVLVGAINGDPSDDICIVMAGYTERIEAMLDNPKGNAGLKRRIAQTFLFEDFDDHALGNIVRNSAQRLELNVPEDAIAEMVEQLARERQQPNFGNAGAANNLLTAVGEASSRRKQQDDVDTTGWTVEQRRARKAEVTVADVRTAIEVLKERTAAKTRSLDTLIGVEPMKTWVKRLQATLRGAERRGAARPPAPPGLVLTGPSGCGKSAVASTVATELDRLQLLGGAQTKEINARELIAGYVNQTVDKVNDILRSAQGRVLVIKDVVELLDGVDPTSAKQALDTIASFMKENRGRICIVLEGDGDEQQMKRLLATSIGPFVGEPVKLTAATPAEATESFLRLLGGDVVTGEPPMYLDDEATAAVPTLLQRLAAAPGWASYSDVEAWFEAAKAASAERNVDLEVAGEEVSGRAWATLTFGDLSEALQSLLRVKGVSDDEVTEVRLTRAREGGVAPFATPAAVNGVIGDFVVDRHAAKVTITPQFAQQCGLDMTNARPVPVSTDAGTDAGYEVTLPSLNVGGLVLRDVPALVMSTPKMLLGMSFLGEIDVDERGDELVLTHRSAPSAAAGPASEQTLVDPRLVMFRPAAAPQTRVQQHREQAVRGPVATAAPDDDTLQQRYDELLYRQMGELVAQKQACESTGDRAGLRMVDAEIKKLHDAATRGVVTPDVAKKIADELQIKTDKASAIAKEVADARAKEAEAQQEIARELAAKQKKTQWVCGACFNRNPGCPFAARNNGVGNIGGFTREVP